jgi:hypothetical protein
MNCDGVNQWLSEGAPEGATAEAARAHVADCAKCQELWSLLAEPLPAPTVALPPAPGWNEVGVGVFGMAAAAIGVAVLLRGGPGWAALGLEARLAVGCYGSLVLGLLTVCLARLRRPAGLQPVPPGWLLAGVVLGYPLLAAGALAARPDGGARESAAVCLSIGLSVALATGAMLWRLAQRGYRAERVWLGAVTGAAGGLVGMLALQVICPDQHVEHVVLVHGLTGLVSVAGGAAASWLAWQRAAC